MIRPWGIPFELKGTISEKYILQSGRSLCSYGDSGWGKHVRGGKYKEEHFSDELVEAAAELIRDHWKPDPFPTWITYIPSLRRPELVPSYAGRLADQLGIPCLSVFGRMKDVPEQKTMENSTMQARNVLGSLEIKGSIKSEPVLLVDDIIDSGWTLTIAGYLLLEKRQRTGISLYTCVCQR